MHDETVIISTQGYWIKVRTFGTVKLPVSKEPEGDFRRGSIYQLYMVIMAKLSITFLLFLILVIYAGQKKV
jgi:hypothetical protein